MSDLISIIRRNMNALIKQAEAGLPPVELAPVILPPEPLYSHWRTYVHENFDKLHAESSEFWIDLLAENPSLAQFLSYLIVQEYKLRKKD